AYLTLGGQAGIDLRTLQELAGHSTPTLTARYSHRRLHDLAGAVEKFPSLLPPGADEHESCLLSSTGTDGSDQAAQRMVHGKHSQIGTKKLLGPVGLVKNDERESRTKDALSTEGCPKIDIQAADLQVSAFPGNADEVAEAAHLGCTLVAHTA